MGGSPSFSASLPCIRCGAEDVPAAVFWYWRKQDWKSGDTKDDFADELEICSRLTEWYVKMTTTHARKFSR